MHSKSGPESLRLTRPLLRCTDQRVIGCSVLFCLLAVGIAFVQQGGLRGRLVEIERANLSRITFQLDVNKSAWPELTQLPRVGETLARRIVRYRDRHGHFSTFHDLEQVEGIGPKTIAQIRPFLLPLATTERVVESVP